MKRGAGIGIGIAITAILVIIAFTNIDDLVSINIEETTSQISSSIQESASQVEFSNPLQTYEVDSTCELAYMMLDNKEKTGNHFIFDEGYLNEQIEQFTEDARKMYEEHGQQWAYSEEGKQAAKKLSQEMADRTYDRTMTLNSIHPKLRDDVILLQTNVYPDLTFEERIAVVNKVSLILPEPYKEDPECGKRFHERFGDKTFKALKHIFGEDRAIIEYEAIKDAIYGT